ncbi:dienelactone hydrolase family protein [Bacteroides sp. UBA939]|uniref:dienelactone hydrolase family protein n=1 Tax=Bacteroides sp. UBA939 TaxID=1946092 RepID=UPI0025C42337|nr:alpha/beta hydrolase family protein [Bacteroides sp. UBA939]
MVKRLFLGMLGLVTSVAALSQQLPAYELEREMPVFLEQLKKELTYPLAWGNSPVKNFKKWRTRARAAVLDAMLAPPPRTTDYQMEVVAEEQREGYRAKKLRFNLTGYSRVNAYLLVPDGEGPFPAVVLLHDHGGHYTIGKEKMIRPFGVDKAVLDDADGWATNCYGGQYVGDYLAAHGYVVISVDALYWGERGRKEGADGSKYADNAGNFMMLGRSLSAFMNYEDMYTTDFLATLPEVNSKRIACMGFSMGAYRAWMLSALSDKIHAGVAVCWMNTTDCQFSWEYGRERGGFANMLPGIRRYLDYPHIASIACPKPMFFLNGEHDKLFPPVGVKAAFAEMRSVWESRSAGDKLVTELWDMPHDCGIKVQCAILSFLDKSL